MLYGGGGGRSRSKRKEDDELHESLLRAFGLLEDAPQAIQQKAAEIIAPVAKRPEPNVVRVDLADLEKRVALATRLLELVERWESQRAWEKADEADVEFILLNQ